MPRCSWYLPPVASSRPQKIRLWLTIVRVYKLYLLTYLLTSAHCCRVFTGCGLLIVLHFDWRYSPTVALTVQHSSTWPVNCSESDVDTSATSLFIFHFWNVHSQWMSNVLAKSHIPTYPLAISRCSHRPNSSSSSSVCGESFQRTILRHCADPLKGLCAAVDGVWTVRVIRCRTAWQSSLLTTCLLYTSPSPRD